MASIDLLHPQTQTPIVLAKLVHLRSLLAVHQLDAYMIPSVDEHLNEYLPEIKQRRQWISGFSGSAGDFLVGNENAWLFVDSRYYEQAELEVDPTLIQVAKLGLDGHQTLEETLEILGRAATKAGTDFRLGLDPFTIAIQQFQTFQKLLEPCGVALISLTENLVDQVRSQAPWTDELLPAYASSSLFSLPDALTGESIQQKLNRVREEMQKTRIDVLPVTKLDQIAWLYNLRGWDVPYNPVFIAYAVITLNTAYLFTNLERMEANIQHLLSQTVTLLAYDQYAQVLRSLVNQTPKCRVLLDPKHTTLGTQQLLTDGTNQNCCQIVEASHPLEIMKARKNAIELTQMQQANLKASRAKIRTLKWLNDQMLQGTVITEAEVAATVERFYAEEADFQGLSFNTIAAAGTNSSIVHYGTPSPDVALKPGEFLLLDSGAQYLSGTTDDTRTVIIGDPTPKQIECYTEVLKAHINCAMQRFPRSTTGAQLDGIARSTLWQAGLNYGHGTGHGVGAFLNVHEGPNGISKRVNQPLEPGMVTSVEPGFYQPGWGGIRLENLYVIREQTTELKSSGEDSGIPWYEFESLTYIPFDNRLIDLMQLDPRQRGWLDTYYRTTIEKLAPTLSPADAEWLRNVCRL
jgi:Xaa-Pro aminopeptidase